jgi:SNF2 family DNA or RNA helicase
MSTLDPVQIAALDFARGKPGVGFFMEQGLGKTLTALAEFSAYQPWRREDGLDYNPNRADRMIVVCPNSFKKGWVEEIEKHGFRYISMIYRSSQKTDAGKFLALQGQNSPPVLIINYEAIRRLDVLKAVRLWASKGKTYLAVDESIQIKGHRSRQTKALHALAAVCAWRRILTGRPQSQGPHDLWGQLRVIGLFPDTNFYAFRGAFCVMGGWQMKEVVRAQNEEILARMMAPVVFYAKKKDWLPELPRKDATIREYKMTGEQKKQYDQMESSFLLYLENNKAITVDVAIAKFEKLAQIQTGFIYDEDGTVHQLVEPDHNPRLKLLEQILSEEIEGKVCIVYRHRPVFDILKNLFGTAEVAWIKGGMHPQEVEAHKSAFNTNQKCRVILLQAEASKYGHTLLGGPGPDDKCRTMVFFENSYSADTRDQIEDRIHRRGQTGERVLYIDFSGSDLDRRIVKALQRKDELYKSVFKNLKVAEPAINGNHVQESTAAPAE